jgi:hypothetical protein
MATPPDSALFALEDTVTLSNGQSTNDASAFENSGFTTEDDNYDSFSESQPNYSSQQRLDGSCGRAQCARVEVSKDPVSDVTLSHTVTHAKVKGLCVEVVRSKFQRISVGTWNRQHESPWWRIEPLRERNPENVFTTDYLQRWRGFVDSKYPSHILSHSGCWKETDRRPCLKPKRSCSDHFHLQPCSTRS